MASQGRNPLLKNGLTLKQNTFKDKVIEQIRTKGATNGTEAAMQVYDVKDRSVAGGIASENLQKPQIRKSIEEELNAKGLSREKLMENIGKIADNQIKPDQKVSPETILKSNIELLKLIGAYPKSGGGGIQVNIQQNLGGLGYSEAKQEFESMNDEAQTFINEAE